ncbi:TniQ family protein [Colwellia sp. 6M3]|uniref:TniQ family protein n=1 Tax=Colwellia sp. 6M3 TaxID=2759849 RepID=UPI0015F6F929|nr:TniQ family protein [Colwellia sp. 6M3]MBA6417549.1 TniQ family protein [Colwellia sp. 6M3]|tara:strand:+ start:5350 stop:6966 length:1617 start_codon:yes stop_codon:yes gene_type:complete
MNHFIFPKQILPIEDESLYGFVQRVANFYGWSKLGAFLDVIYVSNIHQINWFVLSPVTERIINNLAKPMQLDSNQVNQQLYPKEVYSMLDLNKQLYGSHAVRTIRICPLCVSEGSSHKLHWQHVANGYCENHQCELISACQYCKSPIQIEYGVSCGSCFKSLIKATDDTCSILPILSKLSKEDQLQLLTCIESVIEMLCSDNDVFNWRKFIEQTQPRTLASLYFEGFLMLINDNFKNKWQDFVVNERNRFSILGERAVNLPFNKVIFLDKHLLRKIKLACNEEDTTKNNNYFPDFSLMDCSIGNIVSEKDITYFFGLKRAEFASLFNAYSFIHPSQTGCVLYCADKLIEVIRNRTIPLTDDMKANAGLVSFNSKELDLLKFSGFNKVDLLTHVTSKNLPVYVSEQPKGTLIEKLYILKSDLFDILLNNINVNIGGVSDTKLAGMLGTTTSKIDVMIKCGLIKHDGNKIITSSVNDFFMKFEVLNRIGRIKKINIKKLVSDLDTNHGLRPAFAFKTEKLDVAYIFIKTDKFTKIINEIQ